jgi:hypothetical protein
VALKITTGLPLARRTRHHKQKAAENDTDAKRRRAMANYSKISSRSIQHGLCKAKIDLHVAENSHV